MGVSHLTHLDFLHPYLFIPGHTDQKEKTKTAAALSSPKKFLVTQSAILKMLSEAVKSYPGVAEFIIDQTVLNKDNEVRAGAIRSIA